MKCLIPLLLLIAGMLTSPVHAEDMQKHLSETRKLVDEKKYKEALERMIWFHDHALEHQPSMYGVRLSFALSDWQELGSVYPPAAAALLDVRNKKTATLKEGKGSRALFHDVVSINETLDQTEETAALFALLAESQPKQAREYWDIASDAVIEAKRYDLARKFVGNVLREFAAVKATYEETKKLASDKEAGGAHLQEYNENNLVEEALKLIELALATDDRKGAEEIQRQASALVEDQRLKSAIPASKSPK